MANRDETGHSLNLHIIEIIDLKHRLSTVELKLVLVLAYLVTDLVGRVILAWRAIL